LRVTSRGLGDVYKRQILRDVTKFYLNFLEVFVKILSVCRVL
jgi:hypothetical protein